KYRLQAREHVPFPFRFLCSPVDLLSAPLQKTRELTSLSWSRSITHLHFSINRRCRPYRHPQP
ncbi:MAG: hypothetical protein ACOCQT_06775, partial [Desulfovermiculus sp.]